MMLESEPLLLGTSFPSSSSLLLEMSTLLVIPALMPHQELAQEHRHIGSIPIFELRNLKLTFKMIHILC